MESASCVASVGRNNHADVLEIGGIDLGHSLLWYAAVVEGGPRGKLEEDERGCGQLPLLSPGGDHRREAARNAGLADVGFTYREAARVSALLSLELSVGGRRESIDKSVDSLLPMWACARVNVQSDSVGDGLAQSVQV